MFIATANLPDTIPGPLRDRMEVIHLPGYTVEEKLAIATRYLVPRQLEAQRPARRPECRLETTVERAARALVETYTREAGVRNLERQVAASLCRKVAAPGRRRKEEAPSRVIASKPRGGGPARDPGEDLPPLGG